MSYDVEIINKCDHCGNTESKLSVNHTSNTSQMWRKAGCDLAAFSGVSTGILLPVITAAIETLLNNRDDYIEFEPDNGWGDFDSTIKFLTKIRDACSANPNSTVIVCN